VLSQNDIVYSFGDRKHVREFTNKDDLEKELSDAKYEFIEAVGLIADIEGSFDVLKMQHLDFDLNLILTHGEAASYM
jgi:hypothetical protein